MDAISALALRAYPGLVYETPGFVDYFRASTPIAEIAELNIGSRPASRTASLRIEDLRAIPWVFSWGQFRLMLPGWYGFGSAIEQWLAGHPVGTAAGRTLLVEMNERWPFFRSMLSNMAMVLAKTDLGVGSRYAELVPDATLRAAVFGRIAEEHARALSAYLDITGLPTLLADNPTLARSIRNRFPYLDPLNHLQIIHNQGNAAERFGGGAFLREKRGGEVKKKLVGYTSLNAYSNPQGVVAVIHRVVVRSSGSKNEHSLA